MGSNLSRQSGQVCHDSPPALSKVDDGLIALSAVCAYEEGSRMTERFSEKQKVNLSKLVAKDDGRLEIEELHVDGEVLEASKKLDPKLRKAFLLAIEMHARIVRAFLFDKDRADPRATAKRLGPLQILLASFRRQVIEGIDKRLVPLMLAELDIVNHILIQVLPADNEQIQEVEECPPHQTAVALKLLDSGTAVEFHHDKPGNTRGCELNGNFVKRTLSSQDHEQPVCLNPGAPVELESGADCAITSAAEYDIDSEWSIDMFHANDAVGEVSSEESNDSECSFEMIEVADLDEVKF